MCLSLYYNYHVDMLLEQCLPIEGGGTEMCEMDWISMMVSTESCKVWMVDGSCAILPPFAQQPTQPQQTKQVKTSNTISTLEFLRLVAKGQARLIDTPVMPQVVKPSPAPAPSAPAPSAPATCEPTPCEPAPVSTNVHCTMETCTGRCGMPLHTRSNVMLAKAMRTGHILWGDLI